MVSPFTLFAFLSITLFFVGAGLVALVLVRKMPVLAELPEMESRPRSRIWQRFSSWIQQRDWNRYKRLALSLLAFIVDALWRFFVRFAKRSERWAKSLQQRALHLSDLPQFDKKGFPLSSRIRKRAAFVEEERKLIDQLAANPTDIDAYRRLGNLYIIAGNRSDAKAAFSEILRLEPNDEEARRRLRELS